MRRLTDCHKYGMIHFPSEWSMDEVIRALHTPIIYTGAGIYTLNSRNEYQSTIYHDGKNEPIELVGSMTYLLQF